MTTKLANPQSNPPAAHASRIVQVIGSHSDVKMGVVFEVQSEAYQNTCGKRSEAAFGRTAS